MPEFEFSVLGIVYLLPSYVRQLLTAALVGLLIGLEREKRGKIASLRTFSMICLGSCLFTILSIDAAGALNESYYDVTRIAAQIVSGVGFLGAGVIFKTQDRIEGVTTASMIWVAAGMGMACGFNQLELVFWAVFVWCFVHALAYFLYQLIYAHRRVRAQRSKN